MSNTTTRRLALIIAATLATGPARALCVYEESSCTLQCYNASPSGFRFDAARGKTGAECTSYPRFNHDSAEPWSHEYLRWEDPAAVPDGQCTHEQKMMFFGHTLFGPAHPEGRQCKPNGSSWVDESDTDG